MKRVDDEKGGKAKDSDKEEETVESEEDKRKREALLEYSKPNCLTRGYVRRPCLMLVFSMAVILTMTAIVIGFEMHLFTPYNDRIFQLNSNPATWDYDKAIIAKKQLLQGDIPEGEKAPIQT